MAGGVTPSLRADEMRCPSSDSEAGRKELIPPSSLRLLFDSGFSKDWTMPVRAGEGSLLSLDSNADLI